MKIVDIELSDQITDPTAGMSIAQVTFYTDQHSQTHFTCLLRAEEVAQHSENRRRLMFIQDAMRQLMRMPEFRSGREVITFAKRLMGGQEGLAA